MDGIINVNKPSGPTSFAIVAQARRLTREKRVGHGGTLDPMAVGVLPLFLGRATCLVEYLQEHHKTYRAGITLGVATDTYDAEGRVVAKADVSGITPSAVIAALTSFQGEINQVPPIFSAIKRDGQRLYELARQGISYEAEPRRVIIYRLEIEYFRSPLLTISVECGKGTYIRSLANDLGQILGVGAHLTSLERTSYGPFNISNAVGIEQLKDAATNGTIAGLVQPPDSVLMSWPAVTLTAAQEQSVGFGQQLALEAGETQRLRAYGREGYLFALLKLDQDTGAWQPGKVFGTFTGC